MINRKTFFDKVRKHPFGGTIEQSQVDGLNAILDVWEEAIALNDLRHLAYPLATTFHETAATMQPIEEYGKGEGMAYGEVDPTTGQTYYGRGYVQLTWDYNYGKADQQLGLVDDDSLYWHAENALDPAIAAMVLFEGMAAGWFRQDANGPHTLDRYFSDAVDDPYKAREIINGDKHIVPEWSDGQTIGELVAEYHHNFLTALSASIEAPPSGEQWITITIRGPGPITVTVEEHDA